MAPTMRPDARRWYRKLLLLLPFEFRREFGGEMADVFEAQRREARDRGGLAMLRLWIETVLGLVRTAPREHLSEVRQDARYVVRTLSASPAFTLTAIVALAIGIGGNVAVFSLVQLVLLNPLPVRDPARLVSVQVVDRQTPGYTPMSTDNFRDLRDRHSTFDGVAGFAYAGVRLSASGIEPQELFTAAVTGNYFDVLGVRTATGRPIQPADEGAPGAHPVVVLSHGVWTRAFGARASVIGDTLTLNGHPFTIIGVAPAEFRGTLATFETDLFIPLPMYDSVTPGTPWFNGRRWRWLSAVARLREGKSVADAQTEVALIGDQLAQAYPEVNRGRSFAALPLTQAVVNPNQHGALVTAGSLLLSVTAVVLLIACVNLANLLLVRASARAREVALRTALGASRARIVRQLLTESVLLGVAGGAAGLAVAAGIQQWLWVTRPPNFLRPGIEPAMGWEVVLFAFAVSIVTGVLFGLIPALQVSRTDVISTLKEAGRQPSASASSRVRVALLVGQVAFTVIALVAAGLFVRSLARAQQIDPGFEAARFLRVNYNLRGGGYDEERSRLFHQRAIEVLEQTRGIASAAVTTRAPLSGGGGNTVTIPGVPPPPGAMGFFVQTSYASPGYFRTSGIPIVDGRDFTPDDRVGTRLVAIVNETMARSFWPEGDAIGRVFTAASIAGPVEIVGIARDSKYDSIGEAPMPFAYLALLQRDSGSAAPLTLVIKATGDPAEAMPAVRAAIKSIDAAVPLTQPLTGEQVLSAALWAPRMTATLVSTFGVLALLLATIGLYGMTAYTVAQSRQEIGLRLALGATPRAILRMVVGRGVVLACTGAALGIAAGLTAAGAVGSLLYDIDPHDPVAFVVAPAGLVAVAVIACALPARRASRVDPTVTLRG